MDKSWRRWLSQLWHFASGHTIFLENELGRRLICKVCRKYGKVKVGVEWLKMGLLTCDIVKSQQYRRGWEGKAWLRPSSFRLTSVSDFCLFLFLVRPQKRNWWCRLTSPYTTLYRLCLVLTCMHPFYNREGVIPLPSCVNLCTYASKHLLFSSKHTQTTEKVMKRSGFLHAPDLCLTSFEFWQMLIKLLSKLVGWHWKDNKCLT